MNDGEWEIRCWSFAGETKTEGQDGTGAGSKTGRTENREPENKEKLEVAPEGVRDTRRRPLLAPSCWSLKEAGQPRCTA